MHMVDSMDTDTRLHARCAGTHTHVHMLVHVTMCTCMWLGQACASLP